MAFPEIVTHDRWFRPDGEDGCPVCTVGADERLPSVTRAGRPTARPLGSVDDLPAFRRMLLQGGRAGGSRLLSRSSVELMQTNQLSPAQGSPVGPGLGWAYGSSVELRKSGVGSSAGRCGGSGAAAYADPREDSIDILTATYAAMEGYR